MNDSEKRLLWVYYTTFKPIWQASSSYNPNIGITGLFRIAPTFDSIIKDESISIQYWDSYNGWKHDGYASWKFVQKVVDAHRAGKRCSDLANNLVRHKSKVVWN